MEVEIREADLANTSDADAVARLIDEYARLPIGQGAPLDEAVVREIVPGLRRHAGSFVFLAWLDGRAVGVAVCFTGFSTFTAKPLVNIHDLAVSQDCQGRGVGRSLIEAVEAKALSLGCGKLTLEVREDNDGAQRLYRRLGFGSREGGAATFFLSKRLATP
ncbi:MAG: GNAT family N-acetyltransferase [Bryobacterales bacterium]